MASNGNILENSGLFSALKSAFGLFVFGCLALMALSVATLLRAIRRAPSGYETANGFSIGEMPAPVRPRMMTGDHYHQILVGLDKLLEIFKEPGSQLTSEDIELRQKLGIARAHSLRAESGHPFPAVATLAAGGM